MNKARLRLIIIFYAICLSASKSSGQVGLIPGTSDPSKADLQVLTQNRSLVSTTISPTEGHAEGFFVGQDEGSLDISDLKLFLAGLKGENKTKYEFQNSPGPRYAEAVAPERAIVTTHKRRKTKRSRAKGTNLQARF